MRRLCAVVMAAGIAVGATAYADETAEAGRAVAGKFDKAVVTLRLTIKQSYSGPSMPTEEDESTMEAVGTIVDPQGLTVVSLSSTDPSSMYEEFADEDDDFKFEARVTAVKILLSDGKELPASVILRDKDVDLAVVQPKAPPTEPLPYVDLTAAGKAAQFDSVVLLGRLGKVANRIGLGLPSRVCAVISKPRALYVLPGAHSMMGSPAFTLAGEPLGIVTLRMLRGGGGDEDYSMFSSEWGSALSVILPCENVNEVVQQAKTSPQPEAEEPPASDAAQPEADAPKEGEASAASGA